MKIFFLIYAFLIYSKVFSNTAMAWNIRLVLRAQTNTLHIAQFTINIAYRHSLSYAISIYAFSDTHFFNNTKHMKENSTNARRNFSCGNESGRLLLGGNTGDGAGYKYIKFQCFGLWMLGRPPCVFTYSWPFCIGYSVSTCAGPPETSCVQ
jgi:hypothetical protein